LEQRSSPSAPAELTKAYWDVIGERMETATIAIVFAATFLDQFIYLYGCNHFGIEDYEREFDRLSLRVKWLKIPERVHGKAIPENSAAIEMLGELLQVRPQNSSLQSFRHGERSYSRSRKDRIASKAHAQMRPKCCLHGKIIGG